MSISHAIPIDKEDKGNVYNNYQLHKVKHFLVQGGGTLLY